MSKLTDKTFVEKALATTPLNKIATPADIARQIAVMASPTLSGHVNGQNTMVDGGMVSLGTTTGLSAMGDFQRRSLGTFADDSTCCTLGRKIIVPTWIQELSRPLVVVHWCSRMTKHWAGLLALQNASVI